MIVQGKKSVTKSECDKPATSSTSRPTWSSVAPGPSSPPNSPRGSPRIWKVNERTQKHQLLHLIAQLHNQHIHKCSSTNPPTYPMFSLHVTTDGITIAYCGHDLILNKCFFDGLFSSERMLCTSDAHLERREEEIWNAYADNTGPEYTVHITTTQYYVPETKTQWAPQRLHIKWLSYSHCFSSKWSCTWMINDIVHKMITNNIKWEEKCKSNWRLTSVRVSVPKRGSRQTR